MQRIPEPELMDNDAQARAYAEADFEEPHALFVRLWSECWGDVEADYKIVDLGCGPADITVRFAERYPGVLIDGVDGSAAMLKYGHERVISHRLESRVRLIHGRLPDAGLADHAYDAVISNSLLHHLADPSVLWRSIRACARHDAPVLVMDLMRPDSESQARVLVDRHAADAPPVLRHDFYHSLCAAYRPEEVRAQLDAAGLADFTVRAVSDRHLIVTGRSP